MRISSLFLPTLFEEPQDAELISHRLMLRGGFIRRVASGIYSYLPLGYRVIHKIINIIREEMNSAGGQEVLLPMLHPAELWKETGRWDEYGEDMFRLKDRRGRDFSLGPTHEEVITELVRKEVRSYRDLPLLLYQIQTKFRDEIRPRFGVMRGREFIMKDGYSFDCDELGAERTYEAMYKAYEKIFSRCGLTFRVVEAESGLIGGTSSHEFMVSSDSGEDVIVSCSECEYAANLERAECGVKKRKEEEEEKNLELIHTPRAKTVEEVCKFLGVKAEKLIKTLLYETEKGLIACLILGNQEVNETKLRRALDCKRLSLADSATIKRLTKAEVGFTGPIGLEVLKIADRSLKSCRNFVVGGNKTDTHYINANIGRDFSVDRYADIRVARDGDQCPRCEGVLKIKRGIEVGHLFNLGTKYSEAMNAKFLDEKGEEKLIIMGCFGIGVSRVMAAVIEQHHDSKGIIWPPSIAPFEVIVLPVNVKDEGQFGAAVEIYKILQNKGVEVLLDDRDESPGKKFNDSDLIGIPIRITVGKKFRETGKFEISLRRTFEKFYETKEEVFKKVRELISKEQGE